MDLDFLEAACVTLANAALTLLDGSEGSQGPRGAQRGPEQEKTVWSTHCCKALKSELRDLEEPMPPSVSAVTKAALRSVWQAPMGGSEHRPTPRAPEQGHATYSTEMRLHQRASDRRTSVTPLSELPILRGALSPAGHKISQTVPTPR